MDSLKEYVKKCRESGFSDDQIKEELIKHNYPKDYVDKIFPKPSLIKNKYLLIILIFLLVISVGALILYNSPTSKERSFLYEIDISNFQINEDYTSIDEVFYYSYYIKTYNYFAKKGYAEEKATLLEENFSDELEFINNKFDKTCDIESFEECSPSKTIFPFVFLKKEFGATFSSEETQTQIIHNILIKWYNDFKISELEEQDLVEFYHTLLVMDELGLLDESDKNYWLEELHKIKTNTVSAWAQQVKFYSWFGRNQGTSYMNRDKPFNFLHPEIFFIDNLDSLPGEKITEIKYDLCKDLPVYVFNENNPCDFLNYLMIRKFCFANFQSREDLTLKEENKIFNDQFRKVAFNEYDNLKNFYCQMSATSVLPKLKVLKGT